MTKKYIEIIYIGSNNKILKSKIKLKDNLTLHDLKSSLMAPSTFRIEALLKANGFDQRISVLPTIPEALAARK